MYAYNININKFNYRRDWSIGYEILYLQRHVMQSMYFGVGHSVQSKQLNAIPSLIVIIQ